MYYIHFPFIAGIIIVIILSFFNKLPESFKVYGTRIIKDGDIYNQVEKLCVSCTNLEIVNSSHDVNFLLNNFNQVIIGGILGLLLLLLSAKLFKLLYLIFINVTKNEIFTIDTVKKIKSVGYFIIIIGIGSFLFEVLHLMISNNFLSELNFAEGYKTDSSDLIISIFTDLPSIITGLIVLTLAEVFKRGVELQQLENETV